MSGVAVREGAWIAGAVSRDDNLFDDGDDEHHRALMVRGDGRI
jgi:hypothetical protein